MTSARELFDCGAVASPVVFPLIFRTSLGKKHVYYICHKDTAGLPRWFNGKESSSQAGDVGSIPGLGRSPGERHGNPLKYSCLGGPMDGGAWWAAVPR